MSQLKKIVDRLELKVNRLRNWANYWATAKAFSDEERGWNFAAKEVKALLEKPEGEISQWDYVGGFMAVETASPACRACGREIKEEEIDSSCRDTEDGMHKLRRWEDYSSVERLALSSGVRKRLAEKSKGDSDLDDGC